MSKKYKLTKPPVLNNIKTVNKEKNIKTNNINEKSKFVFNISHFFFLISIVIIPNLYYKLALDKHLEIRYLGLALFVALIAFVFLINKKNNKSSIDVNLYKSPVVLLLTFYFLVVVVSYFVAISKSEALYEILKTGLYLILFIYLLQFIIPVEKSEEALVSAFVVLGLIISFIGIFQLSDAIKEHGFGLKAAYSVLGNFAHKNLFSQVLYITFAFSLYGIYYFADKRKLLPFITAILNVTIILLLMTRSVWVAMFLSGILVILVYFFILRKHIPFKKLKKPLINLSVIFGLSFLVFLLFYVSGDKQEIKQHIAETTQANKGNAVHRIALWKKSIPIVKSNPIIGVGAGNWKVEILKYDVTKNQKQKMIVPRRTHNDYITVVSETGFLGLIAFFGTIFLALIQCFKLIRDSENENDKIFSLTLFFIISGYLIYSFFDFPKERIETQIFIHTIIAFAFFKFYKLKKSENTKIVTKKLKPVFAFIVIFAFIATISAIARIKAEVNINQVYGKYRNTNKFQKIYDLCDEANSVFVKLTPFNIPIVSIQAKSMALMKKDKQEILAMYDLALKEMPYHISTLLDIYKIYMQDKEYDKAEVYINKAIEYAPSNILVQLEYIIFLKLKGDKEKAWELLQKYDPKTKNATYKALMIEFLGQRLVDESKNLKSKRLLSYFSKTLEAKDPLIQIYIDAVSNNVSFEKQLYYQAIKEVLADKIQENDFNNEIDSIIKFYDIKF